MNKELKEQAHKEFDEKFAVKHYTDGKVDIPFGIHEEYRKIIKSFLDSLIDKTVQQEQERIVRIIKSNSKGSFTDSGGNDCWYIDELVSLITNNSDINK